MTTFGYKPATSDREERELEELQQKRDHGKRLTPEESARVDISHVLPREEPAMPPRVKIPREPDTSE